MTIRNSAARRERPRESARRERAREHARRDILVACAEVFARRGFAAATLAELAEAAGFAAPSLYRYFESKEEIFRSLVEMLVREMDATFDEPVDRELPLGARLDALLRAQFRIAAARRSVFSALHDCGPDLPEDLRQVGSSHAGFAFYAQRMRAWLRRNASRSELRHPPEVVAPAIAGVVFGFGHRREDADAGASRIPLIVDLALEGIAAPAARRRGAHA